MNTKIVRRMIVSSVAAACVCAAVAEDTEGFESEIVTGLSLTDGNSETLMLNIGASTKKVTGLNEFVASAEYNYGESTVDDVEDTTTDNAKASAQYNRLTEGEKCYYYLKTDALYDDVADIDYRVVIGPGVGHYLIKDGAADLAVELGAAWLTEEVENVEDDYFVLRVAQRYERALSEGSKVWQSVEYLPQFEDFGNYLLNFELGAEAVLTGAASLRVVFTDRYDSEPASDSEENDLSLTAGLVYKI